ncbi:hypothetical protein H5410_056772 [Solanum commersonii]|uniref:Uncharacterized protein n=1 Tax=Solanum commersonii TaxID=4109 RepID=A0A9J5WP11_SOLCO|nr:hypothetical protein H5410_056772 [Solanum commersonii]
MQSNGLPEMLYCWSAYGTRASDIELAAPRKLSETWPSDNEDKSFIRILAICYAAILEQNEKTRGLNYE